MSEDIAITLSKSNVDPCSHGRETNHQKSADGRTAFQLHIVDKVTSVSVHDVRSGSGKKFYCTHCIGRRH